MGILKWGRKRLTVLHTQLPQISDQHREEIRSQTLLLCYHSHNRTTEDIITESGSLRETSNCLGFQLALPYYYTRVHKKASFDGSPTDYSI